MRIFNSITIMASMLMLSFAVSCQNETPEPSKIELSTNEVTLTKTGKSVNEGSVAVVVTSNVYWRAFVQDECEWLTLSRAGGPDGSTEILITGESNIEGERREAKVVFETIDDFCTTLIVRQNGSDDALYVIADNFGGKKDADVVFTHGVGTATGLSYATFVYDGTGCSISSENPSSGYDGASGDGNLLLPAGAQMTLCKLDYHFGQQYELDFGIWAESAGAIRSLSIKTSTDSKTWTSIPFTADYDEAGWSKASTLFDFEGTVQQGWIRFENNSDVAIRIDDILMRETSFDIDIYSTMVITGRTWANGDCVTVFDELFQHEFKYVDGEFCTLNPTFGTTFYALYPADPASYMEDGAIHTTIPATYTYNSASETPSAVMIGKGTGSVALEPATGSIKVKLLKTNAQLASVKVEVTDGPALAGVCDIDVETKVPAFDEEAEGTVEVILSTPIDMAKGDNNYVLVPVPAGTYDALVLTATDNQGTETEVTLDNVKINAGENYEVSVKCEDASVVNMNMPSYYGLTGTDKVFANCYMVTEAGEYRFDSTRPDGVAVTGATGTWVWATSGVWTSADSADYTNLIQDLGWNGKSFFFTVPENFVPGNVIVGVADAEGTILYSWHIWTTKNYSDVTVGGYQWMDRNIGASYVFDPSNETVCHAARGFHFQWGSKNPVPGPYDWNTKAAFVQGTSSTFYCYNSALKNAGEISFKTTFEDGWKGTWEDAALLPMTYIADQTKAYYVDYKDEWPDMANPCPYGYHVMTTAEATASLVLNSENWSFVKDAEGTNKNCATKSGDLILPSMGYRHPTTAVIAYASVPDGRYWCLSSNASNIARGDYWQCNSAVSRSVNAQKNCGMSVRCVRNHE